MEIQSNGAILNITKIDETHFRAVLTNGFNKEGTVYHIDEIKERPFYEEVKEFLK
jgi:hypothetical protein